MNDNLEEMTQEERSESEVAAMKLLTLLRTEHIPKSIGITVMLNIVLSAIAIEPENDREAALSAIEELFQDGTARLRRCWAGEEQLRPMGFCATTH